MGQKSNILAYIPWSKQQLSLYHVQWGYWVWLSTSGACAMVCWVMLKD